MKKKIDEYNDRGLFAEAMLDKYFSSAPGKVVSDIGAGFGHMQHKINVMGGLWQPFDYVRKIDQSIIWDLNYPCPPVAQSAGTVIFLEVLEHLANPLLGIQNISSHMNQGGFLILTTPNPRSSVNRVNLLFKGSLYAFQDKHLSEHHVFTPWYHIVEFFLIQSGFEILEYANVDTAYRNVKSANLKSLVKNVIGSAVEYFDSYAIGMSYGLVARKI